MATLRKNPWRDYRWRESGWTRARAVLALGMVFGLGTVGTMAQWSQTVTAETGLFSSSAGTVEVTINGQNSNVVLSGIPQLGKGQSASTMVNLKNNGTANLKYSVDLAVAELGSGVDLKGQLAGNARKLRENMTVSLFAGATSNGTTCTGGTQITTPSPPVTYTGLRTDVALNAGVSDSYCVVASVSSNAPTDSRVARVGVTFSFNASIA